MTFAKLQKLQYKVKDMDNYIHKNKNWGKWVFQTAEEVMILTDAGKEINVIALQPAVLSAEPLTDLMKITFWNLFAARIFKKSPSGSGLQNQVKGQLTSLLSSVYDISSPQGKMLSEWKANEWVHDIDHFSATQTLPLPSLSSTSPTTLVPSVETPLVESPDSFDPVEQIVQLEDRIGDDLKLAISRLNPESAENFATFLHNIDQHQKCFWSFHFVLDAFSRRVVDTHIPDHADCVWETLKNWKKKHNLILENTSVLSSVFQKISKPIELPQNVQKKLSPEKFRKRRSSVLHNPLPARKQKTSVCVDSTETQELAQRQKAAGRVFDIVKFLPYTTLTDKFGENSLDKLKWAIQFPIKNKRAQSTWTMIGFFHKFHNFNKELGFSLTKLSMVDLLAIWGKFESSTKMQLHSYYKGVFWMKNYLGLPIPEIPEQFRKVPVRTRRPRGKAPPMQLYHLCHLEYIATSSQFDPVLKFFASCVLLACYASLRVNDIQRLRIRKLEETQPPTLTAVTWNSKSPTGDGGEMMVYLVLKSITSEGQFWYKNLLEIEGTSDKVHRDYLIPDIFQGANGQCCFGGYPMPHAKFVNWLNYLLTWETPYSKWMLESDDALRGHSARRLMPTVSEILGFSVDQCSLLGRWKGRHMCRAYSNASREVTLRLQSSLFEAMSSTVQAAQASNIRPLFENIQAPTTSIPVAPPLNTPVQEGSASSASSALVPLCQTEDEDIENYIFMTDEDFDVPSSSCYSPSESLSDEDMEEN